METTNKFVPQHSIPSSILLPTLHCFNATKLRSGFPSADYVPQKCPSATLDLCHVANEAKNASQTETEGQRWDRFLEVLTIQNQMIWDDCGKWKSDGPGRIKPKKLQFFCPTSLVLDLFHVQFTLVRFWWKLMQWSYPWIRCGKKHISGCIRGRGYINSSLDTLPETNLASENRQSLKGKIILQCLILRGYSMLISRIVYKWHGITY